MYPNTHAVPVHILTFHFMTTNNTILRWYENRLIPQIILVEILENHESANFGSFFNNKKVVAAAPSLFTVQY